MSRPLRAESPTAALVPARTPVVVVTGLSGAGKSSALHILEDIGFEAIDNIPVALLGRLLWSGNDPSHVAQAREPLAVGVDIRTRDFHADAFPREVASLRARDAFDLSVVFLDCESNVLVRRFTETRRRHPLHPDRPVNDSIRTERSLLAPVRAAADVVIDTSQLSVAELRRLLERRFAPGGARKLTLSVVSFAYGKGLPREADLVFDVRFLRNPHYDDALRPGSGLDTAVARYIEQDLGFAPFLESLTGMLTRLLPRYREEGKSYLTIAVGCTGGRHRSVLVAERLAAHMRAHGDDVLVRHRDLEGTRARGDDQA
ncbi:MAG: RNase adapter RapZ [Alphaproteobacteria bacterium]|nr:RNase adapter RapZ [Alphaproteobacteria bacterium]